jgi:deoxyribodipyrimidine photo-lyase
MHLTGCAATCIDDNTALSAATERGPTIALWLVSPGQWQAHDDAACKVDFWLRNLRAAPIAPRLNIPLLIRKIDTWDQALRRCSMAANTRCVHWNEEYGINEQRRDDATRALLEKSASRRSHLDQLFPPGTVLTRSGDYFQVFSQFKKTCLEHLHRSLPALAHRVSARHRCTSQRPDPAT